MPEWYARREDESEEQWWHRVNEVDGMTKKCECHPDGYRHTATDAP